MSVELYLAGCPGRTASVYVPSRQRRTTGDPSLFLVGSIRWHPSLGALFTAATNLALTAEELEAVVAVLRAIKGEKDFLLLPLGEQVPFHGTQFGRPASRQLT